MRKISILAAACVVACTGAHVPVAHDEELGRFVDAVIEREMAKAQIPGAAFVFVRNGRIVHARGYGVADIARKTPVDAQRTIWRIGSITKTFTAAAVLTLVESGAVDLERDVNAYLRRTVVPPTFAQPVRVIDLLTHRAGFDELPGRQASTANEVLPLHAFLRDRLVRVRAPGQTIAYSSYAPTVAGALIEDVSGRSYETYLRERLWRPLGMTRTSISVPPQAVGDVAIGYELKGSELIPQAWEWYHTTPASSINSTATDMAKYMIALLEGRPLFSVATRDALQQQQATMHERLPGVTLGLWEEYHGRLRILEHGGQMAGFSSQMVLIPAHDAAFFVVNHFEGSNLRDVVKEEVLRHLYPEARSRHAVPTPPPDFATRAASFTGRYVPMWVCRSCTPQTAPFIFTVTVDQNALRVAGSRWIEVGENVFVREGGTGHIAFRTENGKAVEMYVGGYWTFDRVD